MKEIVAEKSLAGIEEIGAGMWADHAVKMAGIAYGETLEECEDQMVESLRKVREIVKKSGAVVEGLSPFGNKKSGMSGKLDIALVFGSEDGFDFREVIEGITTGELVYRRSVQSDHEAMMEHLVGHLKRCSANGIHSLDKFKKPLGKVGLAEKGEEISVEMKNVLKVFLMYREGGKLKEEAEG